MTACLPLTDEPKGADITRGVRNHCCLKSTDRLGVKSIKVDLLQDDFKLVAMVVNIITTTFCFTFVPASIHDRRPDLHTCFVTSLSPAYGKPLECSRYYHTVKRARFPYPLSSCYGEFPNFNAPAAVFFSFTRLGEVKTFSWEVLKTPNVDFSFVLSGDFFLFSGSKGKKKNIFYIQSLSPFLVDWVRGFEGRWVGSRWMSEIHLCTNAYCLREGNFLFTGTKIQSEPGHTPLLLRMYCPLVQAKLDDCPLASGELRIRHLVYMFKHWNSINSLFIYSTLC